MSISGKTSFLFFFQVSIVISCGQPTVETSSPEKQDSVLFGIDRDSIQGMWTSYNEQRDYSNPNLIGPDTDSPGDNRPGIQNWVIKGDSVWIFHYPCQFYGAHSFKLINDSIYFDGNTKAEFHIYKLSSNGSEILGTTQPENDKTPVISKIYYRDTFDLKVIDMLKRDSVNYDCLVGKMKLQRHVQPEDGEAYDLKFPVTLPDYLNIQSAGDAAALYDNKIIRVNVEGKDRLFYVEEIGWNDFQGDYINKYETNFREVHYLILRPAEWWTGEDFTATYYLE